MSLRQEFKEFVGEARDFRRKLRAAAKDGITEEEAKMLVKELGEVLKEAADILGVGVDIAEKVKELFQK